MTDAVDEWETKNQSRRYPLDELGDVEPFDLLSDMTLAVPTGQSEDDVYVSKLIVRAGKCAITLKRADGKVVASAYGASDDTVDFTSDLGYAGAVSFGVIGASDNLSMAFTPTTGKLAAGVAYQVPGDFYISSLTDGAGKLLGDVVIKGNGDFVVEVGTVEYMSEQRSSIILRPSDKLNDRILSVCQLPPEEVFARLFGKQGLLTINGVKADDAGNINMTLTGLGSTVGGKHYVNLTVERGDMCGIDPILSKVIYPEDVDCSSG